MSATAAWVATLIALVPQLAGDTPTTTPRITQPLPDRHVALVYTADPRGSRVIPRRAPGLPPWRCARAANRAAVCSLEFRTHVAAVTVNYRTAGGAGRVRVTARLVVR